MPIAAGHSSPDLVDQGRRATTGCRSTGFTLIEMLVVILVIALLAGITWPVLHASLRRARIARTQQLVDAVTALVANRTDHTLILPDGSARRRWDFNADGILDGDPQSDVGFTRDQRRDAAGVGYRGGLADLGAGVGRDQFDERSRRLRDAWGGWIRIGFGAGFYGPHGFGVWSDGPDRKNGTDDDIRGWRRGP